MNKTSQGHRAWLNFKVNLQAKLLNTKKSLRCLLEQSKPYLRSRYWLIYLLCFGLGLYLFGPSHGYQKLAGLRIGTNSESNKTSIEALKQELELLKSDLRKIGDVEKKSKLDFNPGSFRRPGSGKIINRFGWVNSAGAWKLHSGVDIAAEPDSNVFTSAPGNVTEVKLANDGTYSVRINHGNDWESLYTGLAQVNVVERSTVIQGVVIGKSGYAVCGFENPGFHFSIYHDHQPVDPQKVVQGLMP